MIKLGSTDITNVMLGTTKVDAIFLGNTKVYPNLPVVEGVYVYHVDKKLRIPFRTDNFDIGPNNDSL